MIDRKVRGLEHGLAHVLGQPMMPAFNTPRTSCILHRLDGGLFAERGAACRPSARLCRRKVTVSGFIWEVLHFRFELWSVWLRRIERIGLTQGQDWLRTSIRGSNQSIAAGAGTARFPISIPLLAFAVARLGASKRSPPRQVEAISLNWSRAGSVEWLDTVHVGPVNNKTGAAPAVPQGRAG